MSGELSGVEVGVGPVGVRVEALRNQDRAPSAPGHGRHSRLSGRNYQASELPPSATTCTCMQPQRPGAPCRLRVLSAHQLPAAPPLNNSTIRGHAAITVSLRPQHLRTGVQFQARSTADPQPSRLPPRTCSPASDSICRRWRRRNWAAGRCWHNECPFADAAVLVYGRSTLGVVNCTHGCTAQQCGGCLQRSVALISSNGGAMSLAA
jgi:hypothetical protein